MSAVQPWQSSPADHDRWEIDRAERRARTRDRIDIAAHDAARMEHALRYIAHHDSDLVNEALTDAGVTQNV